MKIIIVDDSSLVRERLISMCADLEGVQVVGRERKRVEGELNGRRAWLEMHVYPTPEGILVMVSDVTERKQMERWLRGHGGAVHLGQHRISRFLVS